MKFIFEKQVSTCRSYLLPSISVIKYDFKLMTVIAFLKYEFFIEIYKKDKLPSIPNNGFEFPISK